MESDIELIRELDAVNEFFRTRAAKSMQVWQYHVSHSWLELEFVHAEDDLRSTIHCHMTHSMNFGVMAWKPDMIVTTESHPVYRDVVRLRCNQNAIDVLCGSVNIAVGQRPRI